MKLPLRPLTVIGLLSLAACGITGADPSTGRKCADLPCGCLPVDCGNGACCPNGEECNASGGCYSPAPVVPYDGVGAKRMDAGARSDAGR